MYSSLRDCMQLDEGEGEHVESEEKKKKKKWFICLILILKSYIYTHLRKFPTCP
jgi:hypothetical protein